MNLTPEEAEDWAAEFAGSTAYSLLPPTQKEHAQSLTAEFLRRCSSPDEESARRVILDELPLLDLPDETRQAIPDLLCVFLEWLQDSGRFANGRSLGRFVAALGRVYRKRLAPEGGVRNAPVVKQTSDIGRNDPCPCGSGKKYKKCCAH